LLFFAPAVLTPGVTRLFVVVLPASVALALLGAYHPWPPVQEPESERAGVEAGVSNPVTANLTGWLNERFPGSALARRAAAAFIDADERRSRRYLFLYYKSKGDWDAALGHLRRGAASASSDPLARYELGAALAELGRAEEAVAEFRRLVAARPELPEGHYGLASALVERGQLAAASLSFREALRLRPDWPPALVGLARLLAADPSAEARDPALAIRLAERAASLTGGRDPRVLDTLAAAHAAAGDFGRAVEVARRALARAHAGELAAEIRARLARYERGEPYRLHP
jgi:tetratricopeptide (TPR) repeat protein